MTQAATADSLKSDIVALLDSVSVTGLRQIKARIEKKRKVLPRKSVCTPRNEPFKLWKPKHQGMTLSALKLIKSEVGMKSATYSVGREGWSFKFFGADVAQRLVHDENALAVDERSAMAKSSITVSAVTARIVEEANALKTTENADVADANIEMQNSRQDPGWCKATSRGSGVVMNEPGKKLFLVAADRVAARMEA